MKNNFYPVLNVRDMSLQSDFIRLVSLVRERESSLIMLLQEKRQKIWERPQWLLKECEYQQKQNRLSQEIRSIILRWVLIVSQENKKDESSKIIRAFWIKIKMVIKMSLQKIKLIDMLSYALFQKYEYIIDAINCGYDRAAGIQHYKEVQQMIKSRNKLIHQLLNQRLPQIYQRNKSEYRIKDFPSNKINKNVPTDRKCELQTFDSKVTRRPLSQQTHKSIRLNSKEFLHSRKLKKIEHLLQKYQNKLQGVMSAKIQLNLDKKKSLQQNFQTMYELLMEKNMANHKVISKYLFSHSGKVFRRVRSRKNAIKENIHQTPSQTLKKETKTLKRIGISKQMQDMRLKKSGVQLKRALSVKLKRKEIVKIKKNTLIESGFKLLKRKRYI